MFSKIKPSDLWAAIAGFALSGVVADGVNRFNGEVSLPERPLPAETFVDEHHVLVQNLAILKKLLKSTEFRFPANEELVSQLKECAGLVLQGFQRFYGADRSEYPEPERILYDTIQRFAHSCDAPEKGPVWHAAVAACEAIEAVPL